MEPEPLYYLEDPLDYSALNPGIRRTVRWLRHHGFTTVNSGDGKTHQCECDANYPFVTITVPPEGLVAEADRLYALLRGLNIPVTHLNENGSTDSVALDATYFPLDRTSVLSLTGLDDMMLQGAQLDKLVDLIKANETA